MTFTPEADLLRRAIEMVEVDPQILAGTLPVIRGTRIPVRDVAAEPSRPIEKVLADYPSLTAEHVELARVYSAAFPAAEGSTPKP